MPGEFDMEGALAQMSDGLFEGAGSADKGNSFEKEGEVVESPAPAPAPTPSPAPGAPIAPKTWTAAGKEAWAKIQTAATPEEFRAASATIMAEVEKREGDFLNAYRGDMAIVQSIKPRLEPFMPVIQQHGLDAGQLIGDLLQYQYTLAKGSPQERVQIFKQLASDYQIPLEQLGIAAQPAQNSDGSIDYIDPQVQSLQAKIQELESVVNGFKATQQQHQQTVMAASREKAAAEIEAFSKDPAHPYFSEVERDMEQLIRSGVAKGLKDAYDKAVWQNPITREKESARLAAERQKQQEAADAEKVAKAKTAAAANTKSSAKHSGATAPQGSMDDTMAETLSKIRSRDR